MVTRAGISIRRVHAVVNAASGGVGPGTADELAALLSEQGLQHRVSEVEPARLEPAVRAALDTGPDLMIVLGGDGTTRTVAELCGPAGPLLVPLSGGTMNKLGRALYGELPWREALRAALERGETRWAPGGVIAGRAFFCRAVVGAPALWAQAREAVRAHRFDRAGRRAAIALRKTFRDRPLRYALDAEIGRGHALALICPTVSRALDADEGALEAAVLDLRDPKAPVRLALKNLIGDWRDDPDVTVRLVQRARAWDRSAIPAMLDGEFFRFGRRVEAHFRPHAFRALAPPVEQIVTPAEAPSAAAREIPAVSLPGGGLPIAAAWPA